jgi:hypothetical protein
VTVLCLLLTFLGLTFGFTAQAQVYRGVGADGQVVFTDRPLPNGEQLDLPLDAERAEAADSGPAMPKAPTESGFTGPYDMFEIVAPANEQKIREPKGELSVSLVVSPALQLGHRLSVEVDGTPAEGDVPDGTQLLLRGLVLGSHSIRAVIYGQDGMTLAATPVVHVHVLPALPPSATVPAEP